MLPLPLSLLAWIGCQATSPEAFDWKIDRTRVPAVSIVPVSPDDPFGPRTVDALVLSPHRVTGITGEVCGLRTDLPVQLYDLTCYGEPTLIERIGAGVPFRWTPPTMTYPCEPATGYSGYTEGYGGYGYDTGDSADTGGHYAPNWCYSTVPVRVLATSDDDFGSGAAFAVIAPPGTPYGWGPVRDPATADPRLEWVDGEVRAGGQVRLRFSVTGAFSGDGVLYEDLRWYVDDGELLGTGRTRQTGFTDDGRPYGDNRLRIPEDYHGALRAAVVLGTSPLVWTVTTLEVP
ncbi:MAG: hypothetical protein ABMB14_30370 [Myxococcota bacterium]